MFWLISDNKNLSLLLPEYLLNSLVIFHDFFSKSYLDARATGTGSGFMQIS
ncbi:hypothetical protein NSP_38030 [Nodularia spumigena CCY9414]|nr:hypothetical protein NSP_38030 [Nodularia spumigena CCY9414]EAW43128.1 hypothetical protein N9414_00050 [Nodularia spumigena CCY9414]